MDSPILPLIKTYQAHVEEACHLFRTKLGVTGHILAAWKQPPTEPATKGDSVVPQRGVLDSSRAITYSFHGIGCRVFFGRLLVDFDFGPGGRHDGFDAWRLHLYAESSDSFRQFVDEDFIQQHLDELTESRVIKRAGSGLGGHLYYFTMTQEHA